MWPEMNNIGQRRHLGERRRAACAENVVCRASSRRRMNAYIESEAHYSGLILGLYSGRA